MTLYRHSALLLDRPVPAREEARSPVLRVVPVDADRISDGAQSWRAELRLVLVDSGRAAIRVQTSFDGTLWMDALLAHASDDTPRIATVPVLPAFGPWLRAVAVGASLADGKELPRFRALVRLLSDAPFRSHLEAA